MPSTPLATTPPSPRLPPQLLQPHLADTSRLSGRALRVRVAGYRLRPSPWPGRSLRVNYWLAGSTNATQRARCRSPTTETALGRAQPTEPLTTAAETPRSTIWRHLGPRPAG